MAKQFAVLKNDNGGFDVWLRNLVTMGEYTNRYNHLVHECQLDPAAAAEEIYNQSQRFEKKNTTPNCSWDMCSSYVVDFISPGDILVMDGATQAIVAPLELDTPPARITFSAYPMADA